MAKGDCSFSSCHFPSIEVLLLLLIGIAASHAACSLVDEGAAAPSRSFKTQLFHRHHRILHSRFGFSQPAPTEVYERLQEAMEQSKSRALCLSSQVAANSAADVTISDIVSPIQNGNGVYFTIMELGTPPVSILAYLDVGSSLTWGRCAPITKIPNVPVLNTSASSSYRSIPCNSPECQALGGVSTCNKGICGFTYAYVDGRSLYGDYGSESFSMNDLNGMPQTLEDITFGCAHFTNNSQDQGFMGLGGDSYSFSSQLARITGVDKFSYCLVSFGTAPTLTSPLVFGAAATIDGSDVQTTPLLNKEPATFRFVNLQAISVNNVRVNIPSSVGENTILDTGTTFTYIDPDVYLQVKAAFLQATPSIPISQDNVCFNVSDPSSNYFPQIILNFQNAADLELPLGNYMFPASQTTACLNFIANPNTMIIGNFMQQNIEFVFDKMNGQVSFAHRQCA